MNRNAGELLYVWKCETSAGTHTSWNVEAVSKTDNVETAHSPYCAAPHLRWPQVEIEVKTMTVEVV